MATGHGDSVSSNMAVNALFKLTLNALAEFYRSAWHAVEVSQYFWLCLKISIQLMLLNK